MPLKWNAAADKAGAPERVFCQSLADVFEDSIGPIHSPAGQVLSTCEDCREIWDFEDDSCAQCGSDDVPDLTMDVLVPVAVIENAIDLGFEFFDKFKLQGPAERGGRGHAGRVAQHYGGAERFYLK